MKLIASVVVIGLIAAAAEASLSGKELTFVTTLKRPFAEVVPGADDSTGNDRYQGFLVDLVQALAAENDFQFNLKEAQGTGSSFDDTASAVDHVVKGSADVVIGDIAPTHVRGRDVDFTAAFMNAGLSFLYKKRAISGEDQSHAHQDYETIDQLLASDVTLGVVFGSSAWSYVLKSEDSLSKTVWDRIQFADTLELALERVKTENFALLTDTPMLEYLTARDPCVYQVGGTLVDLEYAFMVRKESRLGKPLSQAILALKWSGKIAELKRKWWKPQGDTAGDCQA